MNNKPVHWKYKKVVKEGAFTFQQIKKFQGTVQSRFSDIKLSDNLWFSDYFSKTIFQFTT